MMWSRALMLAGLSSAVIAVHEVSLVGQPAGLAPGVSIRAARVLDGKGGTLDNAVVEVKGDRISAIRARTGPVTYDLGNVTVMPTSTCISATTSTRRAVRRPRARRPRTWRSTEPRTRG